MTVDEYLRSFENKRKELLKSRAPVDYDIAIEAAWNVSLDRLRKENPRGTRTSRYSLAKIDHRNNTLQLHRLVQLVLRNKLSPDD
jgi:hypothetical protein